MTPEITSYLGMIEDLRRQVSELIANLPAEALNWRPIDGVDDHATNSLAVMASHIAGAEHFWIYEVIGRQPSTRDRPAEFQTAVDGPAPLLEKLNQTGQETQRIFSSLTAADLGEDRQVEDRQVSVRWAILHVIDHTALHLGQMQLTYQLWHSGQAADTPRWFQRLPEPDP
jgi:uncharacterized damage-inducible protein DinB